MHSLTTVNCPYPLPHSILFDRVFPAAMQLPQIPNEVFYCEGVSRRESSFYQHFSSSLLHQAGAHECQTRLHLPPPCLRLDYFPPNHLLHRHSVSTRREARDHSVEQALYVHSRRRSHVFRSIGRLSRCLGGRCSHLAGTYSKYSCGSQTL